MAVACLPPHAATPFQEVRPYYRLEGDSSRDLIEQFGSAFAQWRNRPSFSIESVDDPETVNHVPFKKVGTIKVQFKKAKPLQPRVVDIEEFEPE